MLIDWLSLKLSRDKLPEWPGWDLLAGHGDRVCRVCARTGDVRWTVAAWDSVRSDSHQVAVQATEHFLRIQGSPGRVVGHGDAVFGFGSATRDVSHCADQMIAFVVRILGLPSAPPLYLFTCSRIDITCNYDLGSVANVRVALAELRSIEGGRYRVSQVSGDTVYWSKSSKRKSGKAYSKGPHLHYLMREPKYSGYRYSESDLLSSERLLRLELRLGSKYFYDLRSQRVNWFELKWDHWIAEFDAYFGRMIGDAEVLDMTSLIDRLLQLPDPRRPGALMSKALANSVYRTWSSITTLGWQATREVMPTNTWYTHVRLLKAVGFSDGDISAGKVISFRKRVIMNPVSSWSELRKCA